MNNKPQTKFTEVIFVITIAVITIILCLVPTDQRYQSAGSGSIEARCRVLETDNSTVFQKGIFKMGEQTVTVQILDGPDQGREVTAMNLLQGALELEWFFQPGDKGIVGYAKDNDQIIAARMLEPLRENSMLTIFLIFFIALLGLAGWVGVKAVVSFAFTIILIWKVLIPYSIEGKFDPILLAILIVATLCFVVIFLVAGFTKKGWSAFLGAFGGAILTWILPMLFGEWMKVNGSTSEYSTALRFSGYENLDLMKLFYAAIILSASGAIMDIAMDIAAAMAEIKEKKPEIGCRELIQSGLNIGRLIIGTMSNTLLMAYSGGALTMLMFLMAKGISAWRILNMNYLASETLKTISGSIGLIMTVPLTAIISGIILNRHHQTDHKLPLMKP